MCDCEHPTVEWEVSQSCMSPMKGDCALDKHCGKHKGKRSSSFQSKSVLIHLPSRRGRTPLSVTMMSEYFTRTQTVASPEREKRL